MRKYLCMDMKEKKTGKGNNFPTNCREVQQTKDMEINEKIPTGYQCDCSRERIEKALISLGKKELEDMIHDGETIEVGCQFCNKKYPVTVEELKSLLARSRR